MCVYKAPTNEEAHSREEKRKIRYGLKIFIKADKKFVNIDWQRMIDIGGAREASAIMGEVAKPREILIGSEQVRKM